MLVVPVISAIPSLLPALRAAVSGVEFVPLEVSRLTSSDGLWPRARVVIADPGLVAGAALDAAEDLEWLQSTWAGVNALVGGRTDFVCARLSGCFGPLVAEHVFAHVLRCERRVDELAAAQRETRWAHDEFAAAARPLRALTMGVLGAGDVGRHVAGVARAFGMRTLALSDRPRGNFDAVGDLDAVLRESDVLVAALPSTRSTRGLLDGGRLAACGRRPLLINVGRGDLLSAASVVEALDAGSIREAVLDVFEAEPLEETSPLWAHRGVRVTPHVAALSLPGDVARAFAENLGRFREGQPLAHAVDWAKGY